MNVLVVILVSMVLQGADGQAARKRSDYDAIVKRNIFAPPKPVKAVQPVKPVKDEKPKEVATPEPTTWTVTGVFYHESLGVYKAIVEQGAELKVLAAGDTLEKVAILAVKQNSVVFRIGKKTMIRAVGESAPRE